MLETINSPADVKRLTLSELPVLAEEIRKRIVDVVSRNGGHLASSLGAVELTIALHYVFDTPRDKIIWDVGHQAYAHKLLTGQKGTSLRRSGNIRASADSPSEVKVPMMPSPPGTAAPRSPRGWESPARNG